MLPGEGYLFSQVGDGKRKFPEEQDVATLSLFARGNFLEDK